MIRNYLKIAWRNLVRNKAFSVINVAGLALGLACSMVIFLWVGDEKKVDAFHEKGSLLFQVYERTLYEGKWSTGYHTQGLLAEELKRVIPEIQYASACEYAARPGTQNNFEAEGKTSKMTGLFVDTDFLLMFSYPVLTGRAGDALNRPDVIAISRKMADIFFDSPEKAIGKTIRFENKEDLQVTAVFEDIPSSSTQQFDFLRSWTDFKKQNQWVNNWGNTSMSTFVQLVKGADAVRVEGEIRDFIYRYKSKVEGEMVELGLQPYTERYLYSTFRDGYIAGGRIEYVRIFTAIAVFILVIACINFMNLATARSIKRAKEVGLRKVIGAARGTLIGQFIGEAVLLTFFSLLVALAMVLAVLPVFNTITGKSLSMPLTDPVFWSGVTGLVMITAFIAGSYPALFLSSLKPVKIFNGTLKFSTGSVFLRQGLVVFQFVLSVILVTGVIVVRQQMSYIQSKNLGYDRDHFIYIPIEGDLVEKYSLFKNEALTIPGIVGISKMRNTPTVIEHHTSSIEWPGKDKNALVSFADGVVGYDFIKTMKLHLKEGRDFSPEFGNDSASYLLNETAVARMGLDDPLGQTLTWGNRPGKVIGVLKDFHFSSVHHNIDPLIIRLDEKWPWGTILVRIQPGKTREAIDGLEKIGREINPKFPFTYQFSDQEFSKLYKSEEVVSRLSNYFAFLAGFISCLGLFGLATFTASQRTKEIGVRKVLGASVADITGMLSAYFLKPVGVALIIAVPVSWYLVTNWLQNFAYKIEPEWWMFAVSSLLIVLIALITVSFQTIKAAMANPVESLRTE